VATSKPAAGPGASGALPRAVGAARHCGAPLAPGAFPALLEDLSAVEVDYETLPGWQSSTRGVTDFRALPRRAQDYVRRIEALVGAPVAYIGTGPGRHEMIQRGFSGL
jgi:adenylosuccinate synthase